jgi:hypothetical protein
MACRPLSEIVAMTIQRLFALTLLIGLNFPLANTSVAAPATDASVRELLDLTGAGSIGVQVMQQMLPGLKNLAPELPEAFWDGFMKEANPDELVNLVVPIYQKHFSEEEIAELLRFYRSPTGMKVTETLPQVMQESMLAGQEWGQRLAVKVMERARAEREAAKEAAKEPASADKK